MMTGITPVTVTFLAQEILPKGQRVLFPRVSINDHGRPIGQFAPGNEEPAGETPSELDPIHPPWILQVAAGKFLHHLEVHSMRAGIEHIGIGARPHHDCTN
jgi:hypothetical protein